jgi:hypothetical protein
MISKSARIGAPVVGFTFGLLATYTLAAAGTQPVPARILNGALGSRMPIVAGTRLTTLEDADLQYAEQQLSFRDQIASFDDRFTGALTQSRPRLHYASLEMPVHFNSALSDTELLKFAALRSPSGTANGRSDSFDARFFGTSTLASAVDAKVGANYVSPPNRSWVVQLGTHKPVVLDTAITPASEPVWTRIRVERSSRQAADSLCSKLEAAGEHCVVQRNVSS